MSEEKLTAFLELARMISAQAMRVLVSEITPFFDGRKFCDYAIQTATGERNIHVNAYKGHFRIICAVCVRLIQPGKKALRQL